MNRLSLLCLPALSCIAWAAAAQPSPKPAAHAHGQPQAHAHGEPAFELGAVLNPSWQSRAQALSHRDRGLGLGHSDLTLDAKFAPWLRGSFSAVAHSDHHKIDTTIEEAFLEAPGLPGGLQLRAGRFLSQLGYLNELHPHADDFVMRPVLHRAFLGGHYFDNGLRLNWVAPTSFYWRVGGEMLRGKGLPTTPATSNVGAWTLGTRIGGDISQSSSWQLGLSTLRHGRGATGSAGEAHHHHEAEEQGHDIAAEAAHHGHRAVFFGRRMDVLEGVWKWAPGGNARAQQFRLSGEMARVSGFGDAQSASARHTAWYLSAVYRFRPQWEAGVRLDRLSALALHEEGYEPARLEERSVSLAWKRDHMTTVRLQFTAQRDRGGFAEVSEIKPANAVHLQFVRSFGAHGAHAY